MRITQNKLLALLLGLSAVLVPALAVADWYVATGIPVARSLLSSSDFRTEFASIDTNISDKLPTYTGNGDEWVVVNAGGTALTSIDNAAAQTLLSVAIGTDVQAWDTDLDAIAALADTDSNFIVGNGSAWVAETGATARTSLGLDTMATQAAGAVSISGGAVTGITDITVADGGTGSSNASDARTALGLAIGTNVQAYDAELGEIAALADTDNSIMVGNGSAWVLETPATYGATLGLVIGTNTQAWDTELDDIAALSDADSNIIVGSAAGWVAESGNTLRTSLGLAIGSDVQAHAVVLDNTTASYTTAEETKLTNIETAADVTDATNVAAAGAPIISAGAGAPGSTPATEGDIYIDTTGDNSWIATGTVNSADWKQASGAGGGDLLAANNLSDVAAAGTARTNLGLAIGTNVQAYDADLTTWAGITPSANIQSFNAAATYAAGRALLDLEAGTDFYSVSGADAAFEPIDATILVDADLGGSVQAYDADLLAIAALSSADSGFIVGSAGGWVVESGATARTSIGAQGSDADLTAIAALAKTDSSLMVGNGSTWILETGATLRTSLGLAIGSDVQAYDADLAAIAVLGKTNSNFMVANGSAWTVETGATARSSLGLGTLATANSIDDDDWATTDLAVANGGTGSSTAGNARTALGVAIGSDAQAWDADLDAIAALAKTDSNILVGNGTNWVLEPPATARTSLGLAIGSDVQAWAAVLDATTASFLTADETHLDNIETSADVTDAINVAAAGAPIISTSAGAPSSTPSAEGDVHVDTTGDTSWLAACTTSSACWKQATGAGGGDLLAANNLNDVANASTSRTNLGLAIGTNVQAYDAELGEIAALLDGDSNFIVGNGSAWVAETGATARTSMGLGSIATQAANSVSISGGAVTGITDITVADGGTGSSTAGGARTALGLVISTNVQAYDADLTTWAGITPSANIQSLNAAATYAAARTLLDLEAGTDFYSISAADAAFEPIDATILVDADLGVTAQAYDADLLALGAIASTDGNFIVGSAAGWVAESGGTARTSIGAQASDADLTAIAALAKTDSSLMVGNGSNWVLETGNTLRTSLGLAIGTDVQALDTDLTTIAGLAKTDSNIMVGNGSAWVLESGATARTSLGAVGLTGDESIAGEKTFTDADITINSALTTPNTSAAEVGFKGSPIVPKDITYELVLTDAGKTIYKSTGASGETITIPANAGVAFPVGTIIVIINGDGGTLSVAITTDTMVLAGAGTTGTRTLADDAMATIIKVATTTWYISGTGVT